MPFLISLDELDRVKRANGLQTIIDLSEATAISRPTWTRAIKTRRPTPDILNALAELGARPNKVLVLGSLQDIRAT